MPTEKSQIEKFKRAARDLVDDDSEKGFEEKLKRLAKALPPKDDKEKSKSKTPDK